MSISTKKGRRRRLEPPGAKLALLEQQQHIERVVDRLAGPVVAVVPGADLLAIEPLELRGEDGVQIRLRVATERGVLARDGDVAQIVQPREQADLAEFAHPGEEGEADVGIRVLDHRVQVPQPVADLPSGVRVAEVVEDGLVVLIHQHHHTLAVSGLGGLDQLAEAADDVLGVTADHPKGLLVLTQQRQDAPVKLRAALDHPAAETEAHHRKAPPPVPSPMGLEPAEQGLVAGEELSEGVEEQRLAEAPGAREKVVLALVVQTQRKTGFVDVVIVPLADLAEGLNANRQAAAGHG